MDDKTKQHATEKALHIQSRIGYPEFIMDPLKLDLYYANLSVTNSSFQNELSSRRFIVRRNMRKLSETPDKTEWTDQPTDINAYYSHTKNAIIIPAGILQKPFYHYSFPKSLIFGAMGSIIGHELTHAFDNNGRRFDKNGNMFDWWSNKSSEEFDNRTKCFLQQYDDFVVNGQHVSGLLTLGENIADNGGLKLSYAAYNNWVKAYGRNNVLLEDSEDKLLPALNMTRDQQFFLSMAQTWCGSSTENIINLNLITNKHSIRRFRVVGMLTNMAAFYEHFNCVTSTDMNHGKRCGIW
jgi:predicted metalloendopeptidase